MKLTEVIKLAEEMNLDKNIVLVVRKSFVLGGWMGGCESRIKDCLQQYKSWMNSIKEVIVKYKYDLFGLHIPFTQPRE